MQSVNAELQRRAVFAGTAAPALLRQDQPRLKLMVQALHQDAQGAAEQARRCVTKRWRPPRPAPGG